MSFTSRSACFTAAALLLIGPSALYADDTSGSPPSDKIYRCERAHVPLFTNKPSYGCEEYEPRGAVRVAPNGMMFLESPRTAAGPSESSRVDVPRPERAAALDVEESRLCQLYDEWVALNERTSGGFFYQNTTQAARWFALSRIFSSIGIPATGRCVTR